MKLLTTLSCAALLFASTTCHATIRRVNNVAALATTCATCYQSLAVAIANANDGDTIHVEPSDIGYGDVVIDKQLVIIGNGFKLGNDNSENTGLQANTQTSRVTSLTLNSGSDGTIVTGLDIQNGTYNSVVIFNTTSNILLWRNFILNGSIFFNDNSVTSNITIAENYLYSITQTSGGVTNTITGLTIRNNFIAGQVNLNSANDILTNIVVSNNTFYSADVQAVKNAEVANNVFYQGGVSDNNNTIHDNISAAALPPGTNNTVVTMGNVYNLSGSDDGKWDILSSSPYDEAGSSPRGMFSGISPYHLSGVPNIPAIYGLQSTLNTSPGGTVNVTLSTRSNN